jgi:hypothetical protein
MKLSEAIGARNLLEKIAGKEMNGKSALAYAEFVRSVLTEIKEFEVKRADLFKKHGEEVVGEDNKTALQIKPENEKKFKAAITKALNKEIKVEPFDLSESGVSIAPADLINALPLFK